MEYKVNIGPFKHMLTNIKRMLVFAWKMDRKLTMGYYVSAGIAGIAGLLTSFTLKYLIDSILTEQKSVHTSIPLIILLVLASRYIINLISGLTSWTLQGVYFDYLLRYKLQNHISYNFYKKVVHLDMAHLENSETQDLIAKSRDTMLWRLPDMLRYFSYFFSSSIAIIATCIILSSFNWWVPVIVVSASIPLLILRARFGGIQWSIWGSGVAEGKKLWYFIWLFTSPTAIREMRVFNSSEKLLTKFKEIQTYIYNLNKKPVDNYVRILSLPPVFEAIILGILAYSQLPNVLNAVMTVGTFTLFVNMIDALNVQTAAAVLNLGEVYASSLYIDHYFDVLSLPKLIHEKSNPHLFKTVEPPKIEFKNVSFEYPNGKKVLKNVSFVIQPAENIAFVGENGAGKSTIIKLICRFYDVTEGEILINNVNIKDLSLSQWYEFIGTLFQDFVQYHFTVRENISLGNTGLDLDEAIIEAAKKSGADDFIKTLPRGYDTLLGKEFADGQELSIGQWQKLAIARAFYEAAPVLILDEPTSAIDAEAEYKIFRNLEKTYINKTLILVSHRFSTVRNANKIFVVEQGQIVESGTHEELLKAKQKYAKMFLTQAKGYQG